MSVFHPCLSCILEQITEQQKEIQIVRSNNTTSLENLLILPFMNKLRGLVYISWIHVEITSGMRKLFSSLSPCP